MALLSGRLLLWWVAQFMTLVAPLLSDVCGGYCVVCAVMNHLYWSYISCNSMSA